MANLLRQILLLCGIGLGIAFRVHADRFGARSMEITGKDGHTVMTVALTEGQQLIFSEDSLIVYSQEYHLTFLLSEISGWKYSDTLVSPGLGLDVAYSDSPEIRAEGDLILIRGAAKGTTVTLTDMCGRIVVSQSIADDGCAMIDIGSLQDGIYIVNCAGLNWKICLKR